MTRRQKLEQRGWKFNEPRREQIQIIGAGEEMITPAEHRAECRIHRPREGSVLVVFSAETEKQLCERIESFVAFRATRKDLVATVPTKPDPDPDDGLLAA